MKLADFYRVEALVHLREHLVQERAGRIELSIDGVHRGRQFVDSVAPAVRLAIRHEIVDVEAQLRLLGVTID